MAAPSPPPARADRRGSPFNPGAAGGFRGRAAAGEGRRRPLAAPPAPGPVRAPAHRPLGRDGARAGAAGARLAAAHPALRARGVRGASNMLAIMDEQAHFVDDKGASNKSDKAVYDALTPSIAQFGSDGKIINISSPLNKAGVLWDLYNQALEGAENILMIQAPSWEINDTLAPSYLKGRYNMDPIVYDCEFGGNFSERVKAWMPEDYLRRVIWKRML